MAGAARMARFDALVAPRGLPWKLRDILPRVLSAGAPAGTLTAEGANWLGVPAGGSLVDALDGISRELGFHSFTGGGRPDIDVLFTSAALSRLDPAQAEAAKQPTLPGLLPRPPWLAPSAVPSAPAR